MDKVDVPRELRERGWSVIPAAYDAATCDRLRGRIEALWRDVGEPDLTGIEARDLGRNMVIESVGFVALDLLALAPEVARDLDRPELLDLFEELVGPGARIETVSGNLSDRRRPFCRWHNHMGGLRYIGGEAVYPRLERFERIVCVLYLDPLDAPHGEMLVRRRRLGDPTPPPADVWAQRWPEQDAVHCPRGSLIFMDQCSWHAVTPMLRDGRRGFIGLFVIQPGGETTGEAVPALNRANGLGPRMETMLSGAPGRPSATPRGSRALPARQPNAPASVYEIAGAAFPAEPPLGVPWLGATCSADGILLAVELDGIKVLVEVAPGAAAARAYTRAHGYAVSYRGPSDPGARAADLVARWLGQLDRPLRDWLPKPP